MAEFVTHRDRMRAKDAQYFTGRQEQVNAFERALKAVEKDFAPPYAEDRTFFAIWGEGGIGKTSLCREFEGICKQKDMQCIYLDMSRHGEPPISSLTDFLHLLRRRFLDSKAKKLLGFEPFAEFDKEHKRLLNLEKRINDQEESKSSDSDMIEQFSEVGAKAIVGFGEELPVARTITRVLGTESVQRIAKTAMAGGLGLTRDYLMKVFDKSQDVDFYFNREEILIKKFTEAVKNYVKHAPFVLLLDAYEEVMELDIPLRERLLEDFPKEVIFVFSGRNCILDNCNLSWRRDTYIFELCEFDYNETASFLHKEGITDETLTKAVFDFTRGVPLALGLAANAIEQLEDENAAITLFSSMPVAAGSTLERRRIIEYIADRFLSLVPHEELRLIHMAAVLGEFKLETLQTLMKGRLPIEQLHRLERYSFIRRPESDYLVHENVRHFVLQKLRDLEPTLIRQLHEDACAYFASKRIEMKSADQGYDRELWRELTLKITYHKLQADEKEGIAVFYHEMAESLWAAEIDFALQLTEMLDRPLGVDIEIAQTLNSALHSYAKREYSRAKAQFQSLLSGVDNNLHFLQLVHDTLATICSSSQLNEYEEAIFHYERAVYYFHKLEEDEKEAWTLVNIAGCYREANEHSKAIERAKTALNMFDRLKSESQVAKTLREIGKTYRSWGKYEEAVQHYQEAYARFEALQDDSNLANVQLGLGMTFRNWGRFPESVDFLTRSQQAYEKLGDEKNVASLWNHLGITYRNWGKYEEAVHHYQESYARFETLQEDSNIANVQLGLGISYRNWGKYPKSVEYLTDSQKIYEQLGDEKNVARLWNHLGITFRNWGKYQEAVWHYQEAYARFEALQDDSNMANVQLGLGITYRNWGKYSESIDHLTGSQQSCEKLGAEKNVASLWRHLSITYNNWGKYEEAAWHCQEAYARFEALQDDSNMANVLLGLGITFRNWGRFPESVDYLTRSQQAYKKLGDEKNVVSLWHHLGITYRDWGKFEEATRHHQEAFVRFEALQDDSNMANVQLGLGITCRNWGKFPESVDYLTRCQQVYEKLGDEKNMASLWNHLGITYLNWGKYEEAVGHYQKAYARFEALQDDSNMANMQLGLGITYRKYGRHVESLAALNESQEIFEQRQQLIGLIGTLRAEARTFMDMNDHEQAIAVAARALSLSEKDELVQQSAYCHEVLIEAYGGDQIDLARSQFEQATKLYQSLGQELDRADAALEIAKIERDSGDEVVSKNLLEQALAVYERFNRPVKIAKTLRELGIYYQKIGDQAQAREKLQQALSLFQSMEMEVESEKTLPELDR